MFDTSMTEASGLAVSASALVLIATIPMADHNARKCLYIGEVGEITVQRVVDATDHSWLRTAHVLALSRSPAEISLRGA